LGQPRYEIINLEALGLPATDSSYARGINNLGQVAGNYWDPSVAQSRLFLYSPGIGSIDLGPGPVPIMFASGINNPGQISAHGVAGIDYAYRYTPGAGYTLLAGDADPRAINDSGQIVGVAQFMSGERAFRYTEEIGIQDLGSLFGGGSRANAINNAGWVTGSSDGWNVFLYRDDLGMTLLGPGIGWAINDQGVVAGDTALSASSSQAFIYLNGSMQLLGNFGGPTEARGINNLNQVVGTAGVERENHGFIWTAEEGMLDLNSLIDPNSGWRIANVFDINDAGQIVGFGAFNGKPTAVLLNPIPEPSSSALLLASVATFFLITRRKK